MSAAPDALVASARRLFAEQGIEAVSLREVARAAGQKNTNAVQYHFGDRRALLRATLEPFHRDVTARRAALLDALADDPAPDLRAVAEALVRPFAAQLEHEAGRLYLRVVAELIDDLQLLADVGDTELGVWTRVARRLVPDETFPLHRRYAAMKLCAAELSRRAATGSRSDQRLFVSNLVDLVSAVIDAPVSDQTRQLLADRDQRLGRATSTAGAAGRR